MDNSFGKPIIPADDDERIKALKAYEILDSAPEGFFNNLAHIVAKSFDAPIALISLVDKEEVFFKANVGMEDTSHVPRGVSLCSLAVLDKEPPILISIENKIGKKGQPFHFAASMSEAIEMVNGVLEPQS